MAHFNMIIAPNMLGSPFSGCVHQLCIFNYLHNKGLIYNKKAKSATIT